MSDKKSLILIISKDGSAPNPSFFILLQSFRRACEGEGWSEEKQQEVFDQIMKRCYEVTLPIVETHFDLEYI